MNRRHFIKTGLIFVPATIARAQFASAHRQAVAKKKVASGGGASCDSVNDSSLQGYWRMDEASGARADTKGSNNLTDSGSTGNAAAIIGNGASFSGTTNLSIASNSTIQAPYTSDWSVAIWFKPSTVSGVQGVIARQTEYAIYLNGTDLHFQTHQGGGGVPAGSELISSTPMAAGTWYSVVGTFAASGAVKNVYVNNGSPDSFTGAQSWVVSSTDHLVIGAYLNDNTLPFSGIIDEALFTKRLLTSGEITALYNSGSGCRPTSV